MAKASITGLTEVSCREHINKSSYRSELSCSKILGFHLQKLKSGGAWRFRYKDFNNKIRLITLAKYTGDTANRLSAADQAIKYRNMLTDGSDPLAEKENKQEAYRQAEAKKQAGLLGLYLNGIYTRHQKRKAGEGKHTLDMIKNHFADYLDIPMQNLTEVDLKHWQAEKEQSGLSHATIKRAFGALRTMLRHAIRENVLNVDPSAKFQLTPPSDTETEKTTQGDSLKTRRMLTRDELTGIATGLEAYKRQLIEQRENSRQHGKPDLPSLKHMSHPHWFFPFFHLAYFSGLRTGDLYSLNWLELNLTFKRLVKIPNKTKHHNSPIQVVLDLDEHIWQIMNDWHIQQGRPESGFVFPSPVTGNKIDKKAHVTHWKKVLKLGGVTSGLDFYSLRHHFISELIANPDPSCPLSLLGVAKLAGHKSVKMIEQHYGHLSPDTAKSALARRSQAFFTNGSQVSTSNKGVV